MGKEGLKWLNCVKKCDITKSWICKSMGLIGISRTTSLKSHRQFALTQRFLSSGLFHHVLSDYPSQSHNFFNLDFVIPLLLYSDLLVVKFSLCFASKEKGEFNPGFNFLPTGSIKTWRLREWTLSVCCRFPLVTNKWENIVTFLVFSL